MRRKPGYWTSLPNTIVGGERSISILKSWGVSFWPDSFNFDQVGWQRVHLPQRWTISFEGREFLLLDDKERIRGRIFDAFLRPPPQGLMKDIGDALTEAAKNNPPKKKRHPHPPGPRLELQRCVNVRHSFCLGDTGPYSFWIENPYGETIFAIRDVEIEQKDYARRIVQIQARIDRWLRKHYARHKSVRYYWHRFA